MSIKTIEKIHESLVNGQRRQMVRQIEECTLYDFWVEYLGYLKNIYNVEAQLEYFSDAVISYFRVIYR